MKLSHRGGRHRRISDPTYILWRDEPGVEAGVIHTGKWEILIDPDEVRHIERGYGKIVDYGDRGDEEVLSRFFLSRLWLPQRFQWAAAVEACEDECYLLVHRRKNEVTG